MAEAISGMTGSLQGQVGKLTNMGTQWLDKIVPPETRNRIIAWVTKFANEKPMLASFIASHIALTGFPLGLFIVLTISVGIFAILAALIIALLGAVLFIVTCVGFALVFLLPTLFATTAIATFIWLWGFGTYYILKKFNEKPIPGIHVPMKEGLQNEGNDWIKDEPGVNGNPKEGEMEENGQKEGARQKKEIEEGKGKKGGEKGGQNGGTTEGLNGVKDQVGNAGKKAGVDMSNPKESADVGKAAGKASNAAQGVTGGLKGSVPGM